MHFLFHFKVKEDIVDMVELGLILNKKNFTPNGYCVHEKQYLRSAIKFVAGKEKVVA